MRRWVALAMVCLVAASIFAARFSARATELRVNESATRFSLQKDSEPVIATPRLREYFPETLLWQPQIETDKLGRAQLRFKLADNITTWKLSVAGSTVDGEIGIAEKEFRAFQPFFAEHDPPKVLTEGDEIALPVVLRNYLDKPQTVNAEIKLERWFEMLGPTRQRAEVKAGDASRVLFDFRAIASVKDGKQRITAFGSDASDAIEKPVSVHPNGEEVIAIASEIFRDNGSLFINEPFRCATRPYHRLPMAARGRCDIFVQIQIAVWHSGAKRALGAVRLLQPRSASHCGSREVRRQLTVRQAGRTSSSRRYK